MALMWPEPTPEPRASQGLTQQWAPGRGCRGPPVSVPSTVPVLPLLLGRGAMQGHSGCCVHSSLHTVTSPVPSATSTKPFITSIKHPPCCIF